jgi:hypothetical protein
MRAETVVGFPHAIGYVPGLVAMITAPYPRERRDYQDRPLAALRSRFRHGFTAAGRSPKQPAAEAAPGEPAMCFSRLSRRKHIRCRPVWSDADEVELVAFGVGERDPVVAVLGNVPHDRRAELL